MLVLLFSNMAGTSKKSCSKVALEKKTRALVYTSRDVLSMGTSYCKYYQYIYRLIEIVTLLYVNSRTRQPANDILGNLQLRDITPWPRQVMIQKRDCRVFRSLILLVTFKQLQAHALLELTILHM